MGWRTAGGDMRRLSFEEYSKRCLLKLLVRAAVVRDCVVARLVEQGKV